jgi:hypothetical protein
VFVFNERHLRTVLTEYVAYFNHWRPHRSIGQRGPCAVPQPAAQEQGGKIIGEPVLADLHQRLSARSMTNRTMIFAPYRPLALKREPEVVDQGAWDVH